MSRLTSDKMDYEYEPRFLEEYESFKNGNIRDFKDFLSQMDGEDIFLFIKWLQSEGLEI